MLMAGECAFTSWWRPLGRNDRWAVLVLVVLPTMIFGLPALFGHPAIAQDNLIQNFPLRVLTGEQLRSGHLPLLNTLANSGTPLLGGMNAGSFFPLTLLFVIPAPILMWVVNLVVVYAAAGIGLFALLRWYRISTWSAFVPAVLYSLTGAMNGQLVHLGVVQGFALLPWYVLAIVSLERTVSGWAHGARLGERVSSAAPSVLGITALWALTTLSGEPRAIAEMELLGAVLILIGVLAPRARPAPSWPRRVEFVIANAVGIAWGALIGLAQLLPGWSFINISQRTGLGYQFFGAGSLPVRWTSLLLIPDLVGGNGVAKQPAYFTHYNLPEVTGYVGVVALIATFAFVLRVTRRGWREAERPFVPFLVVGLVGLLATWGYYTPVGHLFRAIPLFGSTRLQSRNIILVDLAVLVLLGWWLDEFRHEASDARSSGGLRAWLALAPALAVVALSGALLIDGEPILRWLGVSTSASALVQYQRPTLVAHLLVAAGLVFVIRWWRSRPTRMRWLHVLVAVDALLFFAFTTTGLVGGRSSPMPSPTAAAAHLGTAGRFALIDPSGAHQGLYETLGAPNVNVFTGLASVQGYGALVNALYGNVTATHPMFSLDPCQLADGTFRQLRLETVVVSSDKLATPVTGPMPNPKACLPLRPTVRTERFFGQLLPVRTVVLASVNHRRISTGTVSVQLLNHAGRRVGPVLSATGAASLTFDFSSYHRESAGIVVSAPERAIFNFAEVVTRGDPRHEYRLATAFQQALATPGWRLAQTTGTVAYFRATSLRPPSWLGSNGGRSRVVAIHDTAYGDSWVTVHAVAPTILKRSMEWIPGWRASAQNTKTHETITLHVVRSGLIEQVAVPRGDWTVHFYYHAPHIELGLIGTGVGLVGWLGALEVTRRRRRRARVPS